MTVPSSRDTNSHIDVFQKNYAFTSRECPQYILRTGSFGPCYVLIFKSDQYSALAHVDDTTTIESISSIFKEFTDHNMPLENVQATILGGWKEHPESFRWGEQIRSLIDDQGFKKVVDRRFSKKTMKSEDQKKLVKKALQSNGRLKHILGVSPQYWTEAQQQMANRALKGNTEAFYEFGAEINAKSRKYYLLNEFQQDLDVRQGELSTSYAEECRRQGKEFLMLPLTKVDNPSLEPLTNPDSLASVHLDETPDDESCYSKFLSFFVGKETSINWMQRCTIFSSSSKEHLKSQ